GPEHAARAGAVVDDHRLTEARARALRDRAGHRIVAAARRERHDQPYGLSGILPRASRQRSSERDEEQRGEQGALLHAARCLADSKRTTPAATDTLRLSTSPRIGMRTRTSQLSRVSRRIPSPSAPRTQATASGMPVSYSVFSARSSAPTIQMSLCFNSASL